MSLDYYYKQKKNHIEKFITGEHISKEAKEYLELFQDSGIYSKRGFLFKEDEIREHAFQLCLSKEQIDDINIPRIVNQKEIEIFATPNTFLGKGKDYNKLSKKTIFSYNALYIDVDCHQHNANDFIKDYYLMRLQSEVFNSSVPNPTLIVDTGRGFQIYWKITFGLPACQKIWESVEEKLLNACSAVDDEVFQVDRHVKNCTRVLRIPGSWNKKACRKAKILYLYPENVYTLEEIQQEYLNSEVSDDYIFNISTSTEKKSKKSKSNAVYCRKETYDGSYARALIGDIEKLVKLRNGDCEGLRELMLFIYRMNCFKIYSYEKVDELVLKLNASFKNPLSESEATNATQIRYVEEGGTTKPKIYRYKNKTLIELFKITEEEQQHMKLLINRDEKYRRSNAKRYGKDENGITKKQRDRNMKKEKAFKMAVDGASVKEIADELNISIKTARRYISKFKN